MNPRKVRFWVVVLTTVLMVCIASFVLGFPEEAKFVLQVVGAISVSLAVIAALYGEGVRRITQPHDLHINTQAVMNSFTDKRARNAELEDVLCIHLTVVEKYGYAAVKNCRVWLTEIWDVDEGGKAEEKITFAVPRLMPWAPGEFFADQCSFEGEKTFDFGYFFPAYGAFEVAYHPKQGGAFHHEISDGTARYVFRIEVDGLLLSERHTVQLTAGHQDEDQKSTYIKFANLGRSKSPRKYARSEQLQSTRETTTTSQPGD